MSEQGKLAAAVKSIAWGYIFLHLDFNLGTLDALPNWWGYCLILKALPVLTEQVSSAKLLRPLGALLAVWEGLKWGAKLLGSALNGGILAAIISVVSLYFHFQLLTDLAAAAEKWDCPQKGRILALRTVDVVLMTLLALPVPWDGLEWLTWIILLAELVVMVLICSVLFSLQRALLEEQDGRMEDPPGEIS